MCLRCDNSTVVYYLNMEGGNKIPVTIYLSGGDSVIWCLTHEIDLVARLLPGIQNSGGTPLSVPQMEVTPGRPVCDILQQETATVCVSTRASSGSTRGRVLHDILELPGYLRFFIVLNDQSDTKKDKEC